MRKSFVASVLAVAALSLGNVSSVKAEPITLDQTGFAPSAPISVPGYNPTLAPGVAMDRKADNLGGGTGGNNYAVAGSQGNRNNNNGRTDFGTQYDFERQYRFTGDNQLGKTQTTRQNSLQGNYRGGQLTTETGLLSPDAGKSFAGPYSFGFSGNTGTTYTGIYNKGIFGNALPGVGTGEIDINITQNGYR